MSSGSLEGFLAHRLAMELWDLRRWFKPDLIADRIARCDHVIAIPTKTIVTLSKRRDSA